MLWHRKILRQKMEAKNPTDNELYLRIVNGNHEAFNILLSRHYKRLNIIVAKYVKDKDTQNDILQDVSIKILTSLTNGKYIPGNAPIINYMMTIAYNESINHYRATVKRGKIDYKDEIRDTHPEPSILNNIEHNESIKSLWKHVRYLLNDVEFELIELYYVHELSTSEIANMKGLNPVTLRVIMHKIRKKLAEQLKKGDYFLK